MSASRRPFVGRLDAAGFLLDPAHLGLEEAHRRVLGSWESGARLYELGDRLLLLLPRPTSVRAERAPGLPVVALEAGIQVVVEGEVRVLREADLTPYDLGRLLNLDDLTLTVLHPAPATPVQTVDRTPETAPLAPDVRGLAGIGTPGAAVAKRRDRLTEALAREDGAAGGRPRRRRGSVASVVLRSPVRGAVRRRHQRYVDDLTAAFRGGDWDEALRSAIALGAGEGGATALLPRKRGAVTGPGSPPSGAGRSVPFGSELHGHLQQVYRAAAARLESEGEYLRAAFVHADLLGSPQAAVELLERHGEIRRAAELAEGWSLPPALVVRLWWRAGERERAVRIASVRGLFADAVARCEQVDAAAAVELRRAWMRDRSAAGDHLGAVRAAWPVEALRDEAMVDIGAGIAAGGRTAGTLLAHLLEHVRGAETAPAARHLFDDPQLLSARTAFVETLASRSLRDRALDREFSSQALVALTTADLGLSAPAARSVAGKLRLRADPLLVADLPSPSVRSDVPGGRIELDAREPGQVRTHDAVMIGDADILVALGELGVRLLRPDGRVRARWDVPAYRIVVADHGRRVLLVAPRGDRHLVHQLDLPLGRPVLLPVLDAVPLDSYDGVRPVLVSERGLEWVEPDGDRWRLVWRELTEPGTRVLQVVRTPACLMALFAWHDVHVWRWSLPDLALRARGTFEPDDELLVVATGDVARLQQGAGVAALHWHAVAGQRTSSETLYLRGGPLHVLVSGPSYALVEETEDAVWVTVHAHPGATACAEVRLPPGAVPALRSTPDGLTLRDGSGRVVVIDVARRVLVADLAVGP